MTRALTAAALLALAATGCRNSCQQICVELEDYATECGYTVPADATKTCISDHNRRSTTRDQRQVCAENGDLETIQAEWTCEDAARYMGLE
ncbi:MAG: hypothetical protein VX899_01885 [Myxococcota bacterium]|nr:hypothetical protein [Myxococcota bacterium]